MQHRINTEKELNDLSPDLGIELDLRDRGERLILCHDSFGDGEDFETFVRSYRHKFLIANVKCEGVEDRVLEILKQQGIEDFFLLDLSFPAIVKLIRRGEKRIAVRFSEYEPIEYALALKNKVEWIWVDCFTIFPLNYTSYQQLKKYFKLCLVSPELQGYSTDRIIEFKSYLKEMPFDAICTKKPEIWGNNSETV